MFSGDGICDFKATRKDVKRLWMSFDPLGDKGVDGSDDEEDDADEGREGDSEREERVEREEEVRSCGG